MSYWACAQLVPQRERLALYTLGLAGYATYLPRLRQHRVSHGRKIEIRPPLFPGYLFLRIELQWHTARWSPGVTRIVLDGAAPARVPDAVIDEIRSREGRNGLIELPPRLKRGDAVRITAGPFRAVLGLYDGQAGTERVAVLLSVLGAQRRLVVRAGDVEAV